MVLILSGCRFQEVLSSILAHVGELGWTNCVWGDENLATKKLYPNFQFTAKGHGLAEPTQDNSNSDNNLFFYYCSVSCCDMIDRHSDL